MLGNKGAGKTHLLHSIKHGGEGAWQLLVTPGTYQKDTEFLEYLLFQVIDTLLGGGKQKGARPLEFVGEQLVRGLLGTALAALTPAAAARPVPGAGPGPLGAALRPGRLAGPGADAVAARQPGPAGARCRSQAGAVRRACDEAGLDAEQACELVCAHVERTEAHNTAGLMRRHILPGLRPRPSCSATRPTWPTS